MFYAHGRPRLAAFALAALMCAGSPLAAQERPVAVRASRPAALVPLYVSFSALQALDVHSTVTALSVGARETNPLIRPAVDHPAAMLALKAGATAGVVYFTEKLWQRNRAAAIISMIAVNSAYAMIAAHNYSTAQRQGQTPR